MTTTTKTPTGREPPATSSTASSSPRQRSHNSSSKNSSSPQKTKKKSVPSAPPLSTVAYGPLLMNRTPSTATTPPGPPVWTVKLINRRHKFSCLRIPLTCLVDREMEMKAAALSFNLDPAKWTSSLLYRRWKEQQQQAAQPAMTPTAMLNNSPIFATSDLILRPDQEESSGLLTWTPWLTHLLQRYYETGTLQVQPAGVCQGVDLLLALEYLAILYQPHQLSFSSFADYQAVKCWSDYFTRRSAAAEWIRQAHYHHHQQQQQPRQGEGFIETAFCVVLNDKERTGRLSWSDLTPSQPGETNHSVPLLPLAPEPIQDEPAPRKNISYPSAALLFEFFQTNTPNSEKKGNHRLSPLRNSPAPTEPPLEPSSVLMRRDFALYVRTFLPESSMVTLAMTKIRLQPRPYQTAGQEHDRAVLRIRTPLPARAVSAPTPLATTTTPPYYRSKSELTYPVDELVQEDLQQGKLDHLLAQVTSQSSNLATSETNPARPWTSTKVPPTPQGSPRKVVEDIYAAAHVDELVVQSVYLDLEEEEGEPGPLTKKGEAVAPEEEEEEEVYAPQDEQPPPRSQDDEVNMQTLREKIAFFSASVEKEELPFTFIRTPTQEVSVASTLTYPVFQEENPVDPNLEAALATLKQHFGQGPGVQPMPVEDFRNQALRHEWIQQGLSNRGMADRIERLLKPEAGGADPATSSWDWLLGLGTMCDPRGMMNGPLNHETCSVVFSSPPTEEDEFGPKPLRPCTADASADLSKRLIQSVEQSKDMLLKWKQARWAAESGSWAATPAHDATIGSGADSKVFRVKDRLDFVNKHIEQSRQGSSNATSKAVELDGQHKCREEVTGYEVSTQIDVDKEARPDPLLNEELTASVSSHSSPKSTHAASEAEKSRSYTVASRGNTVAKSVADNSKAKRSVITSLFRRKKSHV